jgi:hypothetical protein
MSLETFIHVFLLKQPATFGEIVFVCENAGYDIRGDREIAIVNDEVLWGGVSDEFGQAIQSLVLTSRAGFLCGLT